MSKSTWIAAVVFVALLAAALVTLREKPERGITRVSFSDVVPAAVTRVVATGKHQYDLRKADDGWTLSDGRPVSTAAADRLVESLPKIASSAAVTQNPDRFGDLEVDETQGTRVIAYIGEAEVADFVVGTDAQAGAHMRVGDSVYSIRGVYQSLFRRDPEAWLEKKLFALTPSDDTRVRVTPRDGEEYALARSDGAWTLEDPSVLPQGFRFDPQQADGLVRALQNIRAKTVLAEDPGDETTGLSTSMDVFTWVDEEEHRLALGAASESGDVYARASGWDFVLVLPAHAATALRKKPTDFRDLSLMTFEPDAIVRLEIVEGQRRLVFERETPETEWAVVESTEGEPDGFELDPAKVSGRVSALGASRGTRVAPSELEADFETPTASLAATDASGETALLRFAGEIEVDGAEGVLARGNVDETTYVAPSFARSHLTGGLASFQRTAAPAGAPPQIDAAALQNLPPEVRAQLLRQMAQPQ